jgi:drug/metabolite transporter (DMT)-like permease
MTSGHGILLKLISVLLFTIMASLIKASAPHVPPGQAVFFRSFFALPVILIFLAQRHELRTGLKTQNRMGHFWRGLIGTSAMALGFAGLGLLPLPEVTAIGFASPLLTVVFAAMFLGETIRLFRIAAVGIGLIGVLVVLSPRLGVQLDNAAETAATLGAFLVLGSAAFRALAQIHIRKLAATEHTAAIVFYFSITATVLSLLTLPMGWVIPTKAEAIYLILAGLIGGTAQIFLTSAYRISQASMIAPFDYASMLFALIFGYVFFAETPTQVMLIGAALIIGAGILIIYREHQLGVERGKARANLTPQG